MNKNYYTNKFQIKIKLKQEIFNKKMKQKPIINFLHNLPLEKKFSNLIKIDNSKKEKEKDNKKKIKYDPYVFRMIQNRNMKKWKSNIVYCVANYMTFEECLSLRLICKLFNDGIKIKYEFLNSDVLFSSDEKIFEKIRQDYNIINQNKKEKEIFKEIFNENTDEESDKKNKIYKDFEFNKKEVSNFSKKNMLYNMIYNKYYMSIKYKTKKGEIFMPKNFII